MSDPQQIVLVTGAGGFIGRHLVATLHGQGVDVIAVEHRWTRVDEIERAIGDRAIAWCAHLGWYAAPSDYLTSVPGNVASMTNTLDLVDLLGRIGCRRIVVTGSCAEYAPSERVLSEDSTIAPWSVYGASKAAVRLLLNSSMATSQSVVWARLFNLTGPGENPDRLFPWILREVRAGHHVPLTSGRQLRDYLDVADVADAIARLGQSDVTGTFNVSSGRGRTVRELIERLVPQVEGRRLLDFGARPHSVHDPMMMVGDNRRLIDSTGWMPKYDTEEMILRVIDYWTANPRRLDST